jgi:tRNA(Ile)-lysidine synthetase-like protein
MSPWFDANLAAGKWVVAVSGGIDSMALLCALREQRPDITPVVCHVNHNLRGSESQLDHDFVLEQCERLGLHSVSMTLPQPSMREASLRQHRYKMLALVSKTHQAQGILTAHHADDRAEGALLRVARNAEPWAIDALHAKRPCEGTVLVRPLLHLRKQTLLDFLDSMQQPYRVDHTNSTTASKRNVVRQLLATTPGLFEHAIRLADASRQLRIHLQSLAALPDKPAARELAERSRTEAGFLVRQWLWTFAKTRPTRQTVDAIVDRCHDAALPAFVNVSPGVRVKRHQGVLRLVA